MTHVRNFCQVAKAYKLTTKLILATYLFLVSKKSSDGFVDNHKLNQTNCCESSRRLISSSACVRRLGFFGGVIFVFITSSVAKKRCDLVSLSCRVFDSFSVFFTCDLCCNETLVFLFKGKIFMTCRVNGNKVRENSILCCVSRSCH